MKGFVGIAGLAVAGLALAAAASQEKAKPGGPPDMEAMMAAYKKAGAVSENHKPLEALVGEWTTSSKMWMDPGAAPMESAGTASAKALFGGRFVQSVHSGNFMGEPTEGISTTGYDNLKKKYVGTWIENMGTSITLVEGTYAAGTKTFTFSGQYDDPMTGGKIAFRFTENVADKDRILFEWYETREGKETKSMEIVYTRKK
jgi:uncharacterized protein DUF1579